MEQRNLAILRRYLISDGSFETPCYIYDREKIIEKIKTLKRNFKGIARIFFAVKANTN